MNKGKLIVLDGLDGSGKSTQSVRTVHALQKRGLGVKLISFPDYDEPSSALVKMYLNEAFSSSPGGVNAYAAGSFYAVDRYASFVRFWKEAYENGGVILATRYTTSNAIHQMGKLPREQWDAYLDWLADYEYGKLGLPPPDLVIFLDMDRTVADRLILSRYGGDEQKKDIHEKNRDYLIQCRETACYSAEKLGWKIVRCDDGTNPRPMEAVTEDILSEICRILPAIERS